MRFLFFFLILITTYVHAFDPRINELKSQIIELANDSEGKTDVDGKLQAALEEKVMDLEKIIPFETMQEKASKITGSWRQVFGPYSANGDGTIPFGSRTDKIYQVIFPNGLFYNVALFEKVKIKLVFLLKGNYKVTDDAIEGVFKRNSILAKNIDEKNLHLLPSKLEDASITATHLPERLPPVGLGGKLIEVYADRDIRILRGLTPQFTRPALYIMEKVKE